MTSKQPNILFILSDQHNAKVLGHKGHPDARTPNLDRMAAEGVRFENAITQNPICTPSRVSWLSGQYCHNHGYYGLFGPSPKGLPTVLGHFRKAGYRTAAIGNTQFPIAIPLFFNGLHRKPEPFWGYVENWHDN